MRHDSTSGEQRHRRMCALDSPWSSRASCTGHRGQCRLHCPRRCAPAAAAIFAAAAAVGDVAVHPAPLPPLRTAVRFEMRSPRALLSACLPVCFAPPARLSAKLVRMSDTGLLLLCNSVRACACLCVCVWYAAPSPAGTRARAPHRMHTSPPHQSVQRDCVCVCACLFLIAVFN